LDKSKQIVSNYKPAVVIRIGIVAYAGSASVLPITTDYSVAKMFYKA
jgi:hypothetical protein